MPTPPTAVASNNAGKSGAHPDWKAALINRRALQRGFRKDEIDDLQQELSLIFSKFVFDPAKANGGSERTALLAIINNHLSMAQRTNARYLRAVDGFAEAQTAPSIRGPGQADHEIACDRAADVRTMLAGLSPGDRAIAEGLMNGDPVSAIAKRRHRSRHAIVLGIARIRDHAKACGLDLWVHDRPTTGAPIRSTTAIPSEE